MSIHISNHLIVAQLLLQKKNISEALTSYWGPSMDFLALSYV